MARPIYPAASIGYYQPDPVGAEGFDEERDAIKRRRLQLEALLAEPKGMTGVRGGIANLALGITRGIHEGNLADQERDLATRRAAAAQSWLERMPADKAAQAEVNPSVPPPDLEQAGGGPPVPTNYAPPEATGGMVPRVSSYPPTPSYEHTAATSFLPASLKDIAKWSLEGAGFSPTHGAIAVNTYKEALERQKGGGDKWEVAEIFDKTTGQPQKAWVNKANPSIAPIPLGGTQFKEPKDSAQTERVKSADEMLRLRFPGKDEAWYRKNSLGLALGDVVITQDASGGVNISSKAGAIGGLEAPTPAAGGTASGATRVPPAVQGQRDTTRLGILQQERADELAKPDSPQRAQNLAALDREIKGAGGASGGAPAADPEAKYRDDERNSPYLPPKGIPGATMSTSKAHIDKLNKDVKGLADDYNKEGLPALITATNQAEATIGELAKSNNIKKDEKTGKYSGNVPGYGGPLGVMNIIPDPAIAAFSDSGMTMKTAMAPIDNIMLHARSGAAVTDQELKRFYREMGQSLGQNDENFWSAYHNFKQRLTALESSVTGGYAPIVRDAYMSRPDAQRPSWTGGGGGSSPATQDFKRRQDAGGKWWRRYSDGRVVAE